jgi:hypothetical protein
VREMRERERVRKIDICEAGFKLALKDFARDRGVGISRQQKIHKSIWSDVW